MSPSRRRLSPPALSDDDIVSVFLRVPPDDPARLVRASLACKAWRRVLTDPQFCRLYREFHGAPPMLGYVVNFWSRSGEDLSRFIPTTAFRLPSGTRRANYPPSTCPRWTGLTDSYPSNWKAVDSRHGRILIEPVAGDYGLLTGGYIVWDPITDGRWGVPVPRIPRTTWTAAVLCAKKHCDHLGCHGHPFLVAMVGTFYETTSACVYSSESGVWSDIITLKQDDLIDASRRSILVQRDTLYFPYQYSFKVLQYKLGEQKLSVIDVPEVDWADRPVLVSAEDGVMVFAGLRGTRLSLCSAEAGALAWTQRTVIELEKVLPPEAFVPKPQVNISYDSTPCVCGFAEGVVFLNTLAGLFTVELSSGRTKKVVEGRMARYVVPWTSFYTQDHARRMVPLP